LNVRVPNAAVAHAPAAGLSAASQMKSGMSVQKVPSAVDTSLKMLTWPANFFCRSGGQCRTDEARQSRVRQHGKLQTEKCCAQL